MTPALSSALVAAVGFSGAGLLALLGRGLGPVGRSYAVAVAAGILLALAFADLFPEALEMAGEVAAAGFVGGFALLFLVESLAGAHTHDEPDDAMVHKHALLPFVAGLGIHNLADGFTLGVAGAAGASGLVGLGVLVHQIPVGVSLAAILVAARVSRGRAALTAVLLGLAIPFAALLTASLLPAGEASEGTAGLLVGVAGGVLAYAGASHLLPETRAEGASRLGGLVFVVTLVAATVALFTVLGD